jgi:hypothetical protein
LDERDFMKGCLIMDAESERKIAIAKLYNLKSSIEGLVQMVRAGAMQGRQAMDGLALMASNGLDEFNEQVKGED